MPPHARTAPFSLLSQTDRHPKMSKNGRVGVLTQILHLAPADSSGYEVCPMRSQGCTAACLNYAGFQYAKKQASRIRRTRLFFEDRCSFMEKLKRELRCLERRAQSLDMTAGVRLNGTSDIPWEKIDAGGGQNIMQHFPAIAFMDYTKRCNRKNLPDNYRLTFSRSESNDAQCRKALKSGMNVAVVFARALPAEFWGLPVIDGDEHDWRYGDYDKYEGRVIVGLRAKGIKGRSDTSGFVVRLV